MKAVTPEQVQNKKVLLRLDLDVPIEDGQIVEEYRLKAALPTLKLLLENASKVIILGHIGRPEGKVVEGLNVAPIVEWLKDKGFSEDLASGKLEVLENLRFDPREEASDLEFAKKLASKAEFFVNEAFASHRPSASTTVIPTLLPHAAGLRFAEEVKVLSEVRENPKKPFIAIMGGAKVKDKLPVIKVLAQKADAVLVGGKLIAEIREQNLELPENVMVGKLNESGFDIAAETTSAWKSLIEKASLIVWNGPLGKFEEEKSLNDSSSKYNQTQKLAEMILNSNARVVIGGGDSVAALTKYGLFEKALQKAFVSVGGGAMLKFLSDGTLPTIEVLS